MQMLNKLQYCLQFFADHYLLPDNFSTIVDILQRVYLYQQFSSFSMETAQLIVSRQILCFDAKFNNVIFKTWEQ